MLASSLLTLNCIATDTPKQPGIIVILSDDMGFSDIGCMGGEIATPNLDSLAAGGVRFPQFYNTARCCLTRANAYRRLWESINAKRGFSWDSNPWVWVVAFTKSIGSW